MCFVISLASEDKRRKNAFKLAAIPVVRFEVFMAVTTKKAVFWEVTACGPCKVITRATRRHVPEDGILFLQFVISLSKCLALYYLSK
jgi:hypothetical protein